MIMEAPLGSLLDTLGEELDAGAKAIQKARVRLAALLEIRIAEHHSLQDHHPAPRRYIRVRAQDLRTPCA